MDNCELLKKKIMENEELKAIFGDRIYDSTRENTETGNRAFILYKEGTADNDIDQYYINGPMIFDFDLVIYMPRNRIKEGRYWRNKIKQIIIKCEENDLRFERFGNSVPYQTGCLYMYPIEGKYTQYECHECPNACSC